MDPFSHVVRFSWVLCQVCSSGIMHYHCADKLPHCSLFFKVLTVIQLEMLTFIFSSSQ